jgi:uncharacterized protein YaaN involved in tellurite resistance
MSKIKDYLIALLVGALGVFAFMFRNNSSDVEDVHERERKKLEDSINTIEEQIEKDEKELDKPIDNKELTDEEIIDYWNNADLGE